MRYQYAVGRVLDYFPELSAQHIKFVLQRCTFVDVAKRYMYYAVPKSGCTQMRELLRNAENAPPIKLFVDGLWQTHRYMFIHARSNVALPSLVELDDRTQREVLAAPDFLRMTVVRNPYTRLVSAWRNRIALCEPSHKHDYIKIKGALPGIHTKSLVSFDEFVQYARNKCDLQTCDAHWRRQVDHTFFPAMNFSYVGRLEQFGEVVDRLERHLGLSERLVAHGRNASTLISQNPYTKELADEIYSLYQSDFEVLGYDRNTWAVDGQNARKHSTHSDVSREDVVDEIVERNLIIFCLYEECDRLKAQLRWVSRLRLVPAIDGLAALYSTFRMAARKIVRWPRHVPRRCSRMEKLSGA